MYNCENKHLNNSFILSLKQGMHYIQKSYLKN